MAGRFFLKKFADINLEDTFFDSLKTDYPGTVSSTGFEEWFSKKSLANAMALVFEDEIGIGAFIVLKQEEEPITLQNSSLPARTRVKISTLRIAERYQHQRIGEGAIGLILWKWQATGTPEIYATVFNKHATLISQLEKFGFDKKGLNENGEEVMLKSRDKIDFSNPYSSFPYIKAGFKNAGYVIIEDRYHDNIFAYSELANNKLNLQDKVNSSVSNGLTKIYVGKAPDINYFVGEPVLIYRKYTQGSGKRFRSCITSYCVITNVFQAKRFGNCIMSFDELKRRIGNKSIFNEGELHRQYSSFGNMTVMELLYYGYFGAGNNVNMDWLDKNGCWADKGQYPADVQLTEQQFSNILTEGKINVSNVIIN